MCVNDTVVDHIWIIKDGPPIPDDDDKDDSIPFLFWIAIGVLSVILLGTIAFFACRKRTNVTLNEDLT